MYKNMRIKDLKISVQVFIGFAVIFFFVIMLGLVSVHQTNQIHEQIETMYNHPLKVRRTIGTLHSDILVLQRNRKDILLSLKKDEIQRNINENEVLKQKVYKSLEFLHSAYLGPKADIESIRKVFIRWNNIHDEIIREIQSGELKSEIEKYNKHDHGDSEAEELIVLIDKIDEFAEKKGDALYLNSKNYKNALNIQLLIVVGIILIFTIIVFSIIVLNIRKPLKELTKSTDEFFKGDLNSRADYESKNEFGLLAKSYNDLAERIQDEMNLNQQTSSFAEILIHEIDAKNFFHKALETLLEFTQSQIAAVYILSSDRKKYNHFESIGLNDEARASFDANNFEGEFGLAISTRKIQHIKNIEPNTNFIFNSVNGKFIPKEIITIPIISGEDVIAIISLSSINNIDSKSISFIDKIIDILTARIEGVLSYQKIIEFSKKLEQQNQELEAQKTELASQSYELIEQNSELEIQKKQLGEVSRLKTNFLSNMSHELRTPLNSIIALSGVLNRRLANQIGTEEYSFLEVVERNGKHLLSLINDILDISRIESGQEEIEISQFNINALINDLVEMIKPQSELKNVGLINLSKEDEILVQSDEDKIRHIFQNLIGNAVKFTNKGKVEIQVLQKENELSISVKDSGIGISEESQKHIFDEFRQADGGTSRKFGGSGLGLAIAKKYAELLGGTITVNSQLEQGSEFILSLPIKNNFKQTMTESEDFFKKRVIENYITIEKASTKTILIVEDSEPAIMQMQDILEGSGYKTLVSHNGSEALEMVKEIIPDGIILDLMMPEIDGFEVLRVLREAEETMDVPVLILTAKHITKDELNYLKRNNIHQLIQKGDVKRDELLNAIGTMVFPLDKNIYKPKLKLQKINGKPKVLVVEDNPDNMVTVKAILGENYIIYEAEDANQGIKMAKEFIPNLILMDIALPGMDGIEAFKIIRNDKKLEHIPVIALTASAMTTDREAILAHGLDAYIPKPIDEKVFFKTIINVLYGK